MSDVNAIADNIAILDLRENYIFYFEDTNISPIFYFRELKMAVSGGSPSFFFPHQPSVFISLSELISPEYDGSHYSLKSTSPPASVRSEYTGPSLASR